MNDHTGEMPTLRRRPGGAQAGAGRPRGATTRLQAKAIEQAARSGLLPHEILLDMARGNPQKLRKVREEPNPDDPDFPVVVVEEEWVTVSVDDQRDAAKAAAPYYAPKLSTVETVQGINDDDLDQLIKQLADQAGVALATGGASQAEQEADGGAGPAGDAASTPPRRRITF